MIKPNTLVRTLDIRNGDTAGLEDAVRDISSGIVLAPENSMIDTFSIDSYERGKVGSQTVNLQTMTGNQKILDLIELMKSKPNVLFVPGTLLRDYGGYVLPVMPVIYNGRVIERVKQTGVPYVDNYGSLAKALLDGREAQEIIENGYDPFSKIGKKLKQELDKKVASTRKSGLEAVNFQGLNVLPLICNEIHLASEEYTGKPVDLILHSSNDLYRDDKEMIRSYEKVLAGLRRKGKLGKNARLAYAELREDAVSKGSLAYANLRLQKIN